ncbi:calmodulin-lysine N-methyltransferase [Cucurbita pepo subsp. pepo]|uniref:calmodulin-lysine N-methyltransferase n=1 Tax=Cucurbita pepo subsp. pepo TaxID=3664 RepID=UPI000C9D5F57|nr:calmodulin-lysine N-methyltransferase [Cucurbita pepo subsp. pepo]
MRRMDCNKPITKASSLRWKILRQALIPRSSSCNDDQSEMDAKRISRRTTNGFNLIPSLITDDIGDEGTDGFSVSRSSDHRRDRRVCYTLPIDGAPKLFLKQRMDDVADLDDFKICNKYDIDNTGLVCHWPSEDVLAYFCLLHSDLFRCKRVIELGSGYGLAGLVVAASTEASEVVITDGNPQVVEYIQHNIAINSKAFGGTRVDSLTLHWNQEEVSNISGSFDLIIASDCTFFKDYHRGLARMVMSLLKKVESSEAIFISPRRGDSLVKFLEEIKANGLHFSVIEEYDAEVWKRHEKFSNGDDSWPGYEKDHCYPLLVRITL